MTFTRSLFSLPHMGFIKMEKLTADMFSIQITH